MLVQLVIRIVNLLHDLSATECIAHKAKELSLIQIHDLKHVPSQHPLPTLTLLRLLLWRLIILFLITVFCDFRQLEQMRCALQVSTAFEAPISDEGRADYFVYVAHTLD